MKQTVIFIAILAILVSCKNTKDTQDNDGKAAILMVHFGTSHDDTRTLTIDAINAKAKEAFQECDVFEAYTSSVIIKILKKRGIEKSSPREMLEKLIAEGYKNIYIQPTHIIPGKEYKELALEAQRARQLSANIILGEPLLYSIEDCQKVTDILGSRHAQDSPSDHVVLVGHGTEDPANALYCQADYMFQSGGYENFHVATIEGFPGFDQVLALLQKSKAGKVTLVPFMFVAGDHALNDISEDWKKQLQGNGFQVDVKLEGLGQIPEIQDLYIRHLKEAIDIAE